MSWKDDIKTTLSIRMGDGRTFTPKWVPEERSVDYNIASFEFPNIAGTLVYRSERKGYVLPLTLFFDGADHLVQARAFEASANDKRAWTLTHPYYGILTVQPAGLKFDNSAYNVTKITTTVFETITAIYPQAGIVPADKIAHDADDCDAALAEVCAADAAPTGTDAAALADGANKSYAAAWKEVPASQSSDYYNAYREAVTGALDLVESPLDTITEQQRLYSYPAQFTIGIARRVTLLRKEYDDLAIEAAELPFITQAQKLLYMALTGTVISAYCRALSTPLATDYAGRPDVLTAIAQLTAVYNGYLATLDSIQTPSGGDNDSFVPDATSLMQLDALVSYTLSSLFVLALDARQERTVILEQDSNWIMLAHRFYGLKADDSTIDQMIAQNGGGLIDILQVEKGREIIY